MPAVSGAENLEDLRGRTFAFIYSSLAKAVVREITKGDVPNEEIEADSYERLSQREREVLQLVAQGYTNQQVATHLYLSVKTVETYKARVMEKLDLHSRVELVRYTPQRGLLKDADNSPQQLITPIF